MSCRLWVEAFDFVDFVGDFVGMLGCGHSGNATAKPSGQPYRAGQRDFVGYVAVLFDDDWGSIGGRAGAWGGGMTVQEQ